MSDVKGTYLIAGGPGSSPATMVKMCKTALEACDVATPSVAYIGTASEDDKRFFLAMKAFIAKAGARKVTLAHLASDDADVDEARRILEECDSIFISGGEVDDGMDWLKKYGIDTMLKDMYADGKLFFGMSAGSIMMGTHWVQWEDDDYDKPASTFDCLGLVPAMFDTHAEKEDWRELKTLLQLMGPGSEGHGLVSKGMVHVDQDGSVEDLFDHNLLFRNVDGTIAQVG